MYDTEVEDRIFEAGVEETAQWLRACTAIAEDRVCSPLLSAAPAQEIECPLLASVGICIYVSIPSLPS